MKLARIVYSPTARDYLKHLPPAVKSPLREAIEELALEPLKGKPLQEEFEGFRSHRFKKYRIIYRHQEKQNRVEILFGGPRSNIYTLFSDYLKKIRT